MQQAPKTVTYKELMIVYGMNESAAQRKLWCIRGALGKKRSQSIHIAEFCQVENIDRSLFEAEILLHYKPKNFV